MGMAPYIMAPFVVLQQKMGKFKKTDYTPPLCLIISMSFFKINSGDSVENSYKVVEKRVTRLLKWGV
jgi:hypothetical protein